MERLEIAFLLVCIYGAFLTGYVFANYQANVTYGTMMEEKVGK